MEDGRVGHWVGVPGGGSPRSSEEPRGSLNSGMRPGKQRVNKILLARALGRVGGEGPSLRGLVGGTSAFGPGPGNSWGAGCGEADPGTGQGGARAAVPKAAPGARGAGTPQPRSGRGESAHEGRRSRSAAAQGAGPHLQARDQGLESGRRAAQTCPAGRRRGAFGGSRRKISSAWGSAGEERGRGQTESAAGEDLAGGGGGVKGLPRRGRV